jgi:hypothetical protein
MEALMKSSGHELPLFSKEWWKDTFRVVVVSGTIVSFSWPIWLPYAKYARYIIRKIFF